MTRCQLVSSAIAASTLAALAASAGAQVLTITSQSRYLEASASYTIDGTEYPSGIMHTEAPENDFGPWTDSLTIGGMMTVGATQTSGYDGAGTFQVDAFTMNFSGGGGPGTSGTGTVQNVVEYSFHVNQPATYTLNGFFGGGLPVVVSFRFTGPGVSIIDDSSATSTVTLQDVTGQLVPGDYHLKLSGIGTISFVGPGGNGSGAGGGIPIMTLAISATGTPCVADVASLGGTPGSDGQITVDDLVYYLQTFFAGDTAHADIASLGGTQGADGQITVDDLVYFLQRFFAGC